MGQVFRDGGSGRVCGLVEHLVPSPGMGDATYIQFAHEDWVRMYSEYEERFCGQGEDTQALVLGWYHTHPNMPVSMSAVDRGTHKRFFQEEWQFSAIFNPQGKFWAVYNGKECSQCGGLLYLPRDWTPQEPEPEPESQPWTQPQPQPWPRQYSQRNTPQESAGGRNFQPARQFAPKRRFEYPKQIHSYQGELFYLPYHDGQGRNNYAISCYLVKKLRESLTRWNLPSDAFVELHYLVEGKKFWTASGNSQFTGFRDEFRNVAAGATVYRNENQWLRSALLKPSRASRLVVLYSAEKPNCRNLCAKFSRDTFVLWINAVDPEEFLFFNLDLAVPSRSESRFQIKNRREQAYDGCPAARWMPHEEICGDMEHQLRALHSIQTEEDEQSEKFCEINADIVLELLKRLTGYSEIEGDFCMAMGYRTNVRADWPYAFPQLDSLQNLWFYLEDGWYAEMGNLSGDYYLGDSAKCAKFVFTVSNHDVDIKAMKRRFLGYTTALCFNMATQTMRFYRLT